jgi:hypothetical protein
MNYATGEYENVIRVTNTAKDTYEAGFVTGYTGAQGEQIWGMCHALFDFYRVIEVPPNEVTDCPWIRTERDAEKYLLMLINYMGGNIVLDEGFKATPVRRISFAVSYITATTINGAHKPWHVGMHFLLTLPHETDMLSVQCAIESITIDVNQNRATVTALMFSVDEQ